MTSPEHQKLYWERDTDTAMDLFQLAGSPSPISGDHKPQNHQSSWCICHSLSRYAEATCTCACHAVVTLDIWELVT